MVRVPMMPGPMRRLLPRPAATAADGQPGPVQPGGRERSWPAAPGLPPAAGWPGQQGGDLLARSLCGQRRFSISSAANPASRARVKMPRRCSSGPAADAAVRPADHVSARARRRHEQQEGQQQGLQACRTDAGRGPTATSRRSRRTRPRPRSGTARGGAPPAHAGPGRGPAAGWPPRPAGPAPATDPCPTICAATFLVHPGHLLTLYRKATPLCAAKSSGC